MPIRLPNNFPAGARLNAEGIDTLEFERAEAQDIRPLKVVLLNLMPTKIDTEVQLLRLISRSSIQIDAFFLRTSTHEVKYGADHLDKFYVNFDEIKSQKFDAIIITGAPLEQLEYEDVDYWNEMMEVVRWANDNVFAELFICWAANAALYIDFDIPKVALDEKISGIYPHRSVPAPTTNRLLRGLDDTFNIPQSRWTTPNQTQLQNRIDEGKLVPLAVSSEIGVSVLTTPHMHKTFLLGHFEYDRHTLDAEYRRDIQKDLSVNIPKNYYPKNDIDTPPNFSWNSAANLFFINWIDYVYQETPYDLDKLVPCRF